MEKVGNISGKMKILLYLVVLILFGFGVGLLVLADHTQEVLQQYRPAIDTLQILPNLNNFANFVNLTT